MCSHFRKAVPEKYGGTAIDLFDDAPLTHDVFPKGSVAVLICKDGEVVPVVCSWGLIPHWATDTKLARSTFNARGETIHEKPTFRPSLLGGQRCIICVECFFENIYAEGSRRKIGEMAIRLRNGKPMQVAGLYAINTKVQPEPLWTCTMVTTSANEVIAPFHHRMPVILSESDAAAWLNPKSDPEGLRRLLAPCSSELLLAEPA